MAEIEKIVYVHVSIPIDLVFDSEPTEQELQTAALANFIQHPALDNAKDLAGYVDGYKIEGEREPDEPSAAERAAEKFKELDNLMRDYDKFGARDSEPVYQLDRVTAAGKSAQPFPLHGDNPWELYSSIPGWRDANLVLVRKAHEYWCALVEQRLGIKIAN